MLPNAFYVVVVCCCCCCFWRFDFSKFNNYFRGADSFHVALVTLGGVATVAAVVTGVRALSDEKRQKRLFALLYDAASKAPGALGAEAAKQRAAASELVAAELLKSDPQGVISCVQIPERGVARAELLRQIQVLAERDATALGDAKLSGAIYWGDREHTEFLGQVQALFLLANPLHPELFPAVGKFERETIAMTKCMLGAKPDDGVCGIVTSGKPVGHQHRLSLSLSHTHS